MFIWRRHFWRRIMKAIRKSKRSIPLAAKPTWRQLALAAAKDFYDRDIQDGTAAGDQVIGQEIIGGATGRPDPDYRNHKTAWCGYFVQCCLRKAGFNKAISLASPGKTLFPYGHYRAETLKGADAWALDNRTGDIEAIQDLHRRLGKLRTVTLLPGSVQPGDIILHFKKSSWSGHVMMAWSADEEAGTLTVIEGNSYKTIGPGGKRRDGVGKRVFKLDDPYLRCAVSPSELDFDPAYRYFATRKQAENAWAKLQEGSANG